MRKKILFISQSINQPRVINRVNELSKFYDDIQIFTFIRNVYEINNYKKLLGENIEVKIIGSFENGKYLKRFFLYLKLIILLISGIFKRRDVYSFGLDCGLISQFLLFNKKTYEISDILWLYSSGIKKRILKNIDFLICILSQKICFTSEGFYKKYYKFLKSSKIHIVENKFKPYDIVNPITEIKFDKISIGIIGALRYPNILENMLKIISKRNNLELNLFGDGGIEINDLISFYANQYENIKFYGTFKNPDDLESIYKQININFVCYDNKLENEQVALPNKFYESGYFNIPLVSSKNTFLSEKVLSYKMGWAIEPNYETLCNFFESINIEQIIEKHNNIKKLNKSLFYK